jgi:hypothetical protein
LTNIQEIQESIKNSASTLANNTEFLKKLRDPLEQDIQVLRFRLTELREHSALLARRSDELADNVSEISRRLSIFKLRDINFSFVTVDLPPGSTGPLGREVDFSESVDAVVFVGFRGPTSYMLQTLAGPRPGRRFTAIFVHVADQPRTLSSPGTFLGIKLLRD